MSSSEKKSPSFYQIMVTDADDIKYIVYAGEDLGDVMQQYCIVDGVITGKLDMLMPEDSKPFTAIELQRVERIEV